ncbi:hypothetical protein [Halorubellus salinus]|uniref:hypothetical protein n=1 Tax=Halorubellus salinus TaxID=755309 RepID=UPI001D06DF06|nr:hypothetical protein [Halorubellus salinus]
MSDGSDDGRGDEVSVEEPTGGWLLLAVLVVGVLAMLLVGSLLEAPLATETTDLGIGFAWLLAAAYVGFRMEGRPTVRLVGSVAFVGAAIARFVALLFPSTLLEAVSLLGLVVGAGAMLVVARARE